MGNYGAIFIRLDEPSEETFDEVNATLKKEGFLFTLRYHERMPWIQAWVDEPDNVSGFTETVSGIFKERRVIGLSCQSVVDAIGYWEMTDGKVLRVLEYGFWKERTWERVEGEPCSWEREVFGGREGYVPGANPEVGSLSPFFSSFDLQKIGNLLELPGFGVPAAGENWTREVIN